MSLQPANREDTALLPVLADERRWVGKRRELAGLDECEAMAGLALSGGGIRSATFSLGILQALSHRQLIPHLDYLSTVSGGSYIGSFFGALYVEPALRGVAEPDLDKNHDARRKFSERPLQSPRGRKAVARLREFGRYLTPGGFSDTMYGMSLIARNWVALQLVLGLIPLLFFLSLAIVQAPELWLGLYSEIDPRVRSTLIWAGEFRVSWALLVLIALSGLTSAGLAIGFWYSRREVVATSILQRVVTSGLFIAAVALSALLVSMLKSRLGGAIGKCVELATEQAGSGRGGGVGAPCPELFETMLAEFPMVALTAALLISMIAYFYFASIARAADVDPGEEEERVRSRMTRALATSNLCFALLVALLAIDLLGISVAESMLQYSDHLARVTRRLDQQEVYAALRVALRYFWPFVVVVAPAVLTVWAHSALRHGNGKGWLSRPAGQGMLGVSILFLWLVIWSATARTIEPSVLPWVWLGVALALLIVSFCYGFLNLSSLVSLYALRLKRAYVGASNPADADQGFDIDRRGDHIAIADYYGDCEGDSLNLLRPVHLINCTIAQTEPDGRSQVVAYDRKGKPLHVSPAGIVHQSDGPGRSQCRSFAETETLPLSAWTAISGAAASTAIGSLTSLGLSILAMMANVRLGYWWKASNGGGGIASASDTVLGYLTTELQGRFATDETRKRRWYLSDGGHFENTGAYALLQRRLDFIVVCDNGADPDYRLDDMVRLIDRARTDLNAEIEFFEGPELDRVLGGDTRLRSAFGTYRELARPATPGGSEATPYAALARIRYDIDRADPVGPDDTAGEPRAPATHHAPATGMLLLIKPRLNFTEPPELLAYQRREKGRDFPQQTTLDQVFDEEQWEAYRRFGEVVGERLFAASGAAWSPAAALQGAHAWPAPTAGAKP